MTNMESGPDGPEATTAPLRIPMFGVELVTCIVLLVVSGLYISDAMQLPAPMNASDVGAGRFPLIAGWGVVIATVLLLVRLIVLRMRGAEPAAPITVGRPVWVLVGTGLLILQAELFEVLGAIPVVVISSLLVMLACGERRPIHLIATPIVLAAMIYGLFTLALGIQLP